MNIPVLHVEGNNIAETYEKALTQLYSRGIQIKTQYDGDNPPSIDSTMNMTIYEPLSDPMIHKAFPGGIEDLKEYVLELLGYKDHWVKNIDDNDDKRWEYTYSGRLKNYGYVKHLYEDLSIPEMSINQIEIIINKLIKQPFTRQAQMITWMPWIDNDCYDPPCLQSLWYRITEDENGIYYLNCNIRFRSNDAWGASFMNMFGITQFNKLLIADEIVKRTGKQVKLGRLNWQADSYHIYGKDIKQAEERLFNKIRKQNFEDRTMNFHDEMIQDIYNEAEEMVIKKIIEYDERKDK